MNICFITGGIFPVPAVEGGAVQNLIESLIRKNDEHHEADITVISIASEKAETAAMKYKCTRFLFLDKNMMIERLDKIVFLIACHILKVKKTFRYRYIFRRFFYISQCSHLLIREEFDRIVLVNDHTLFMLLRNKRLKLKLANKLYFYAHSHPSRDFVKSETITAGCPNVIAISNFIGNEYKHKYGNVNIFVLKNAIDTFLFSQRMTEEKRIQERGKYGLLPEDTVLLFAGRISDEKGIIELARAFAPIDDTRLKLLIVGSNFYTSDVKSPIMENLSEILLPCKNRVFFTGYIPYNEMWKLYRIADIGCFPSIWDEPAMLTGIEAMVAELPIITTNAGGIPEYIQPECAVILNRDKFLVDNITRSIVKFARDAQLRNSMSTAGTRAGTQYNLDTYYTHFIEIMHEHE